MSYPGLRQRAAVDRPPQTAPSSRVTRAVPPPPPQQRQGQQGQQSLPPPMTPPVATTTTTTIVASAAPVEDNDDDDDFARQAVHLIPATVRMISACHTTETSADCRNVLPNSTHLPHPAGRAGGACTSTLLDILYRQQRRHETKNAAPDKTTLTFQELLLQLRSKLSAQGLTQIPQLTSSRPLDVQATPFDLGGHHHHHMGTKRALLIGINYRGQVPGELSGCHNDVRNMQRYLTTVQGFDTRHIVVLVDDDDDDSGTTHKTLPTRKNIVTALRQLVAQSVAGDAVFVLYSGHGGLMDPAPSNYLKQRRKDFDETLYPLDHQYSGSIRDFNLYRHFVQPMPAGVTVTAVMDCCHSGSVLDLPYAFQPTRGSQGVVRMRRNMDALANVGMLYLLMGGMFPGVGFDSLTHHIQGVTGGNVEDFQGLGLGDQEAALDGVDDTIGGFDSDTLGAGNDVETGGGGNAYDYNEPGMDGNAAMDDAPSMGGEWYQGVDDFDSGGDDIDCSCIGDVLSNLLTDD